MQHLQYFATLFRLPLSCPCPSSHVPCPLIHPIRATPPFSLLAPMPQQVRGFQTKRSHRLVAHSPDHPFAPSPMSLHPRNTPLAHGLTSVFEPSHLVPSSTTFHWLPPPVGRAGSGNSAMHDLVESLESRTLFSSDP